MVSTAQGSAGSSCRFSTSLLASSSSSVLFLFLFLYLYFYFLLNNTQRDYLAGLVNKNKGIMLNIIVGLSLLRPPPHIYPSVDKINYQRQCGNAPK